MRRLSLLIALCLFGCREPTPVAAPKPPQPTPAIAKQTPKQSSAGIIPDKPPSTFKPDPIEDLPAIVERLERGVLFLTALNSGGERTQTGSGFVIDKSGLVVTNYHLVAGASTVTLETPQGKTLAVAGYRAVDRARDLILLQLAEPPEDLEPLVFADPNEIRAGDEIIGVGHPEGREIKTVIGGIRMIGKTASTSAEYRTAFGEAGETFWLQSGIAVPAGSSGGPLLNHQGQVIGINTWLPSGGQSPGYAMHMLHLVKLIKSAGEVEPLPIDAKPQALRERIPQQLALALAVVPANGPLPQRGGAEFSLHPSAERN